MTETKGLKEPKGFDIGLWLSTHDWVYWALAIGGVAGMGAVLWYYLRSSRKTEAMKA